MSRFLPILLLAASVFAEDARWIRYPSISPNGQWVAFSYRGDLWRVRASGGEARLLTSHVGYERSPCWSPDGEWIAFASDRHGNFDVFLIGSNGGAERRLTFHSSGDIPTCFSPDGRRVFFSSSRQDAPEAAIGSAWAPELYSVSIDGGRPHQELTTPAEAARISSDGKRIAYQDWKGWENRFRKHHVSPVTKDIAVYDIAARTHTRLTKWGGEDRNPVWVGGNLRFLSERSGSSNVWAWRGGTVAQVTKHATHPVRFLSASTTGMLCYAYNGELYTLKAGAGAAPTKVTVLVHAGARRNAVTSRTLSSGATGFAVSPNEKEVAFVVRGEVFVASVKHGTTKRITNTPEQERTVVWAPDGRTLYYAAERGGSWNLFKTSLAREDEKYFFHATTLKEEAVLVGPDETFQPVLAPDGEKLAYLHNRDEIRVLDLKTKQHRVLVPADRNYSYSDGDIIYGWSPDSQWLASVYLPQRSWIENIAIVNVNAGTGKLVNVTLSGYYDWMPRWSLDGKALLFISNRLGRRNHGSWGADSDVFALYLTQAAYDETKLTREEYELAEKDKKDQKDKKDEKEKGEEKDKGEKDDKKKVEPVAIEFKGHENRLKRLTLRSSPMRGFAISPDGQKLVYFARIEGKWDLWVNDIRKAETRRLFEAGDGNGGDVVFSKDGDAVFIRRTNGKIARVELEGKAKGVGYSAEMTIDGPRERQYIFGHVWRQTRQKFYDRKLHGVDWVAMRDNYQSFLGHIENNHDFADLLSEMVGELNASHTGSRYRIPQGGADQTAALGILFDPRHVGAGLKVAEVLERGPVDRAGEPLQAGALLTNIDGVALAPRVNPWRLLNRKAGKRVLLKFSLPGGRTLERVVKPVSQGAERNLRYLRWVKQRRELTEQLSKGRLGYVHVRGMNDASFRVVFREALGRLGAKEGLIVDTRFNGGGWLHDDLIQFLSGRRYLSFQPPGKKRGDMGGEPLHRWARPSVVLQNEANYSDAHMFPYAYKELGIGKLVGAPVAGTGTAVWWERQIDPSFAYGIPQVGMMTPAGKYLENMTLQPDVLVYNDTASMARGQDKQLEKAVEVLIADLKR